VSPDEILDELRTVSPHRGSPREADARGRRFTLARIEVAPTTVDTKMRHRPRRELGKPRARPRAGRGVSHRQVHARLESTSRLARHAVASTRVVINS
jgi:hypothetical protein